jgi:gas vesicle protein GvpG
VIVIDRMIVGGVGWVMKRLAEAADAELLDEGRLREELLAAQLRFEEGEIGRAELEAIERDVLERMARAHERREEERAVPGEGERYAVEAIEADVGEEASHVPARVRQRKGRRRR